MKTSKLNAGLIATLAVLLLALPTTPTASLMAQTPGTSTLRVRITGARNAKGRIGIELCRDPKAFPCEGSNAADSQWVQIDARTLTAQAVFERIPQGVYAVAVFHDENMNGKLDSNFFGIPKEGYGASNNPKKRIGPPKFEQAKFSLNQPECSIEISLMYW
jgi:uncharacterized protein (DUF2141 family)